MPTITRALIDIHALKSNIKRIKHFVGDTKILAILKDNAYGHDDEIVAEHLEGIDSIGLNRIEDVISLRERGCTEKIVLFSGLYNSKVLKLCIKFNAEPVITSLSQLSIIKDNNHAGLANVWIKIDTGMNRLGILPEEVFECYQGLKQNRCISTIKWMTHFACADQADNEQVISQIDLFENITKDLPGLKSAANSAAIIQYNGSHYDIVRPGLMLYGASPISNSSADDLGLLPVMTLKSTIVAIKRVTSGQCVGYGATWSPSKDSIIAIAGIGYGDGYPQFAPNGTHVLIDGKIAWVAGRVSMDLMSIDITHLNNVNVSDEIILWGNGLPVEEIARQTNQSPYSLLTGVSERVTREIVNPSKFKN